MEIGASMAPRRQASSQGAAHTRPQTDAKGLGARATRKAVLVAPVRDELHVAPRIGRHGAPRLHLTCAFQSSMAGRRTRIDMALVGASEHTGAPRTGRESVAVRRGTL